jgi:hypothetical protein
MASTPVDANIRMLQACAAEMKRRQEEAENEFQKAIVELGTLAPLAPCNPPPAVLLNRGSSAVSIRRSPTTLRRRSSSTGRK